MIPLQVIGIDTNGKEILRCVQNVTSEEFTEIAKRGVARWEGKFCYASLNYDAYYNSWTLTCEVVGI